MRQQSVEIVLNRRALQERGKASMKCEQLIYNDKSLRVRKGQPNS